MTTANLLSRCLAFAAAFSVSISGQAAPAPAPAKADLGWPRQVVAGDSVITMYQPQVDSWKEYKELSLRAAIGVRGKSESSDMMGVLQGTAQTVVDNTSRNVAMSGLKYTVRFPGSDEGDSAWLEQAVRTAFPGTRSVNIALDRVLAYLDTEKTAVQKEVPVSFDPPQIFYSSSPAILLMFMGEPSFTPVNATDPSLLHAVNTNWDVFLSAADQKFYVLNDKSWLETSETGEAVAAKTLPQGLLNLPDDANWEETRKNVPGEIAKTVPTIFKTTTPAELIITDGEPKMREIPGTQLKQITNTPSLLFMSGSDQHYYFLVAGRWFKTKELKGPWEAASAALPEDFSKIPDSDAIAEVRSSVKGTPETQDAIMLASVPTLATVTIDEATLEVVYEGEPKFEPIAGGQVQYAVNTAQDVFLVGNTYYCCSEGVWFSASDPKGPWILCVEVDPALYNIPADHPKHNVTYVEIYDTGIDSVTYGYTSGYTGSYISDGLLVFGAGMVAGAALDYWLDDEDDDYHVHYPVAVPYYSYGVAAHYNYGAGGYYGAAHYYGPYGGAGRYAAYNPVSGVYSRGAAVHGPYSSAAVRQAYNPWTDTYAARARVNTPTGSAGRFYAERDGEEVWGGSRSGSQGRVGWAQTSEGGKGAAWDTRRNEGAAVKNKQGDVLVGNDGNIYKREDGNWQKYDDGGWDNVNRPDNARGEGREAFAGKQAEMAGAAIGAAAGAGLASRPRAEAAVERANTPRGGNLTGAGSGTRAATRDSRPERVERQPTQMDRSTLDNLERQTQARTRGNTNTQRAQQARSSSSARATQRTSSSSRPQQSARPSSGATARPSTGVSRGGGGGGGGGRR